MHSGQKFSGRQGRTEQRDGNPIDLERGGGCPIDNWRTS